MTSKTIKPTATERVRAALADEIVRGLIAPGQALDEASLAERFSVSRTPVREAIRQLEAIGFVEARPHRGAVVPHFTPDKLNEMFEVMAEMEGLCARYAALRVTAGGRRRLEEVLEACRTSAARGDIDAYYETNLRFHETIYRLSRNAFLADVTLGVRHRLAPFRKAQFESAGRLAASAAEHGRIVERVLAGDADGAASAMRAHLQVVRIAVGKAVPTLSDQSAKPDDALRDRDALAAAPATLD
ncbi:MAG: GntR family transcriptional regulator [Rhizobiaceae bacterium]|nr:GntR family transcriptional regulator [Rhizobiaceae bacterium]